MSDEEGYTGGEEASFLTLERLFQVPARRGRNGPRPMGPKQLEMKRRVEALGGMMHVAKYQGYRITSPEGFRMQLPNLAAVEEEIARWAA